MSYVPFFTIICPEGIFHIATAILHIPVREYFIGSFYIFCKRCILFVP